MSLDPLLLAAMAGVLALVGAVATRPWWRRPAPPVAQKRANIAAYCIRLAEIEEEQAAGLVEAGEAEALREELGRRLVQEADAAAPVAAAPVTAPHRALGRIALCLLFLLAFSVGGYWLQGSGEVQRRIAQSAASQAQVTGMVERLAADLQQHPENAEGWALLGRSYFVMQRFDAAARAYAQANDRSPAPQAEWLTDEGEALAFARDRDLAGRPTELFESALKLEPDQGKALWYAGLAAAQARDAARARLHWTKLLQQPQLPPEMHELVQTRLAALEGGAGPSDGSPSAAEAAASALHVQVRLAPELADKVPPGAVLFVFAKAENGPSMPLAVQRLAQAKLPLDVDLDDRMGMTPAMRLSQFDRYVVGARLSASGGAQAAAGDLQGFASAQRGMTQPVTVKIDQVVR